MTILNLQCQVLNRKRCAILKKQTNKKDRSHYSQKNLHLPVSIARLGFAVVADMYIAYHAEPAACWDFLLSWGMQIVEWICDAT